MRFLADTSVVSETARPLPTLKVNRWLQTVPRSDIALSVVTIHELRVGTENLPKGRRRLSLERWIETLIQVEFVGRLLPVNVAVADLAAVRSIAAKGRGHNVELADALIAATAEVHHLQVVTLNRRHFQQLGVPLVDL